MLYRFFNSSSLLSIIVLAVSIIVLWIPAFYEYPAQLEYNPVSPLYNFIAKHIVDFEIIAGTVCMLMIFLQAIVLNGILDDYDILPKNSYLAAFVFAIIASSSSEFIHLSPFVFSGLFLILAIGQIFMIYGKQDAFAPAFNAGLFISLASMCYFPAVILFLLLLLSFIVYRQFFWREWFISILGLVLPYTMLGVYYFWTDQWSYKIEEYLVALRFIELNNLVFDMNFYIQSGFIALFLLFAVFRLIVSFNEKQIRIRKAYSIIIWYFLSTFLVFALSANYHFQGYWFFIIPVSAVLSGYLLIMKNKAFAELWLFMLLGSLLLGRLL